MNILIINDDVDSPLGYLLPSLRRKVEIPGNLLQVQLESVPEHTRGVAVRCLEGGESSKELSSYTIKIPYITLN